MTSWKCIVCIATLALLAVVCHAAIGANSDDGVATSHAFSSGASGDETASIPDFDSDGTIGFGDFLILASAFGSSEGDEKYDATYDLNEDGKIGFSDFVIFAQNFGKEAPSPVVAIPDANLRAAIEMALGKDSGAPITQAEMATLDRLDANDADISDLTGLQFAVNLTYLSLNDNDIKDISALASLTGLERLWLSNNGIEDISALAKLDNLTELWLWNNRVEHISALSGLTGLTRLSLGRNNIEDIRALSGLINLRLLILKSNRVSNLAPLAANKGLDRGDTVDVTDNPLDAASEIRHIPALQARGVSVSFNPSPAAVIPDANLRAAIAAALGKAKDATITLAEMKTLYHLLARDAGIRDLAGLESAANMTSLDLSSNNITDFSPLAGLTNLRSLNLFRTNISDISALAGLTSLTRLYLWYNNITDLAALAGLTSLRQLALNDNSISNLSALSGLTNLTWLDLSGTNASDLPALAGLTNLTWLNLSVTNISNLSALSGLTDLTWLDLYQTNVSDLSPLAGLTNLTWLDLSATNVTNLSALSALTDLTWLDLSITNVSNLSALSALTDLTELDLFLTNITDLSALSALTDLKRLYLSGANISDISALSGLTSLKELTLWENPLSFASINETIPALRRRGVTVLFDPTPLREREFNIELVFLTNQFDEARKNVLRFAARRWMSVITQDLPDYIFAQGSSGRCGDHSYAISSGERIDDVRIYVTSIPREEYFGAWGGPRLLREESHLPVVGCMGFGSRFAISLISGLHEIGHVVGFGAQVWARTGFRQNLSRDDPNADTHFNGRLAIAAFDDAGGRDYRGAKVPVAKMDGSHWRGSVFGSFGPESRLELMTPGGGRALSAITVQSMADLGYSVDISQAYPFSLPLETSGAKIAVATPAVPGVDVSALRPEVLTQSGDGLTPDLADNRQIWDRALPSIPAPELTCGAGLMNDPVYVVDQQGRIVRPIYR